MVYAPTSSYSSDAFDNFAKYVDQQGIEITIPQIGESFSLGSSSVQIIAPNKEYADINETSIVLKITYGNTRFLFTGDAGRASEMDILEAGFDLSATVLKVGHHGSDTSTSYPFLREVMPQYAIISVGKDNDYSHPTEEVLSRLRDADVVVLRTDMQGDIVVKSDGETVTITPAKNASAQTNPTVKNTPTPQSETTEPAYIGNKKL